MVPRDPIFSYSVKKTMEQTQVDERESFLTFFYHKKVDFYGL